MKDNVKVTDSRHPQPIDYGLSWRDITDTDLYGSHCLNTTLKYKEHKVSRIRILVCSVCYLASFLVLSVWCSQLPLHDYWFMWALGMTYVPGSILWFGICKPIADANHKRKLQTSGKLLAYKEALRLYEVECKAAHEAELRKRSYWEVLDGYAFEHATAEVLNKHQFDATVTRGSGDGGIDIEVTKNGLKGVVQCKARVACAGPHVVRDLYGVMHHSGADFGIIVSRGGVSQGAVDFARDKPIHFLDTDDLIAMQEGRDVLASAFSRKDS
jgi:hypothetical protein